MNIKKIAILLAIFSLLVFAHHQGWTSLLTLEHLQANRLKIDAIYQKNPIPFIAVYALIYIVTTALSIPGALILTLAGGAILGGLLAALVIALSASLGAQLAFWVARYILRDTLEAKYASTLKKFNDGLTENAFNYLLFLRLIPLFPFFLINLVMGLTRIRAKVFFIGTAIGILPGTFVFANAGRQLALITSLDDITSPELLIAFTLLGLFALIPVLYKKIKKGRS